MKELNELKTTIEGMLKDTDVVREIISNHDDPNGKSKSLFL